MAGKYEHLIVRKAVHVHDSPTILSMQITGKARVRDGICSV